MPFQLIGVDAKSAYSTVSPGRMEAFSLMFGNPIETIKAEMISARNPTLSRIQMGAPESDSHLVSGFYNPDNGQWRWMSGKGVLLLKREPGQNQIQIKLYLPESATARNIEMLIDGQAVLQKPLLKPGLYDFKEPVLPSKNAWSTITLVVDRTFTPPNDQRKLGLVVSEIGFLP